MPCFSDAKEKERDEERERGRKREREREREAMAGISSATRRLTVRALEDKASLMHTHTHTHTHCADELSAREKTVSVGFTDRHTHS